MKILLTLTNKQTELRPCFFEKRSQIDFIQPFIKIWVVDFWNLPVNILITTIKRYKSMWLPRFEREIKVNGDFSYLSSSDRLY